MFYNITIILSVKFLISEIVHVSILSLFYRLYLYKWLILCVEKTRLRDSFWLRKYCLWGWIQRQPTCEPVDWAGSIIHTAETFQMRTIKNEQTNEHHHHQQKYSTITQGIFLFSLTERPHFPSCPWLSELQAFWHSYPEIFTCSKSPVYYAFILGLQLHYKLFF